MSDSAQPRRRQFTRLLCPWDSPGKNTGVGCHFLLQCMKVKSESEVHQLCLMFRDPMDCSLPGFSVHEIFQARVLEWIAISFSNSIRRCDKYYRKNKIGKQVGRAGYGNLLKQGPGNFCVCSNMDRPMEYYA